MPLAAAASMTLTLYAAHIVLLNSPLDVLGPFTGYAVQVAVALGFAMLWRRGPLESGVTWLAHRERHRRSASHLMLR